jgi:hypothetical protein
MLRAAADFPRWLIYVCRSGSEELLIPRQPDDGRVDYESDCAPEPQYSQSQSEPGRFNQNNFLGFQIADVKTGKVLQTVEVKGFSLCERWFGTPRPRVPHACPTHGIALTNDETEVGLPTG